MPDQDPIDVDYQDVPDEVDTLSRDINGFGLTPAVLPNAYVEVSRRVPDHKYKRILGHIDRMAGQGMEPHQIATRLGIPPQELMEAAERYEDVQVAFIGGRARMIDQMTFCVQQSALKGNTKDAKFFLQTKGEFTPSSRVESGNLPQNGPAPVDMGSIANRLQDQRGR